MDFEFLLRFQSKPQLTDEDDDYDDDDDDDDNDDSLK